MALSAVILLSVPSAAAQVQAGDHPALLRFPEAAVLERVSQTDVLYQLVLGNLRRVAGQVVPERVERLRGSLTRITYEIPGGFNGEDVIEFYVAQAQESGYQELFRCEGRACGNSAHWANNIFGNRALYGPERNQYYLALRTTAEQQIASYAAVYVITRTNRRLYAHVEILDLPPTDPGAGSLVDRLLKEGSVQLDGLQFDEDDGLLSTAPLQEVLRALTENADLRLYIVSHMQGAAAAGELIDRSTRRAEVVRQALIEAGAAAAQIDAFGVGPLAPVCRSGSCAERMEIVLP